MLGVTSHSAASLVWFAVAGMAVVPLALAFTLRWGSLYASLAILSGVMSYGLLAWFSSEALWPSALLVVLPVVGIAAVCLTPRRWQVPVIWATLIADWLLIVFYPILLHHSGASIYPSSIFPVTHMVSLAVLAGSGMLLLTVQATTQLQSRGRFERLARLVG